MPTRAAATRITPRHRALARGSALALAACLLPLVAAHGAEFSSRGVPAAVAEDGEGRISFSLQQQDLHYWIEPRSAAERAALLASLRQLAAGRGGAVVVSFGINGAGIPRRHRWLEYRIERLRRLAGGDDLYAEPARAPHRARPEMRADSPLDIALLRGVPLLYSRQLEEALAELNVAVRAAEDASADEGWKKVLAYKSRGLTLAALARANLPDSDADQQFLASLDDLREWQRLQVANPWARYEIGAVLEELGAYPEALGVYQGIGRDWSSETYWPKVAAAAAYRQMRDYPRALAALDELSARDRDSMPYHYQRAWILEQSGQVAEAVTEYTAGLQSQPDYVWALLRRGCAQAGAGHLAEARADNARAIGLLESYPSGDREIERAHEQATRLAAGLADGDEAQARHECAALTARGAPRARSELLPSHIGWLPLTSTPRGPHGLSALTPTQFRLLVLAVLALVVGGAIVLVRRLAATR